MGLSVDQQARAAQAHIKTQLLSTPEGKAILLDVDFASRLEGKIMTIFAIFAEFYGYRDDSLDHLTELVVIAKKSWSERSPESRAQETRAETRLASLEPNAWWRHIDQLRELAVELRKAGISLVVDLVFKQTSNEHKWAKKAIAGDAEHSAYYWLFPDRNVPQAFERTTREIVL
ncbi:hypothetical protein MMC13_007953 [Lambiella insularis]|nr:hypothetical protein [Lambiella insularis]